MPEVTITFSLSLAVVALGSFLQGSTGFGFAMFAAPLLAVIDPALVPGPILVLTLLLSIGVLTRDWNAIDWPGLFWILAGRLPATLLAGWFIGLISRDLLSVIFALFVLAGVVVSLWGEKITPTPGSLVVAGALSGFFGTLTSIGAPPLALVYQSEKGPRVRGTLSANIVIGVVISIIALSWGGRFSGWEVARTFALLPAGVAGIAVSHLANAKLDRDGLRPVLLGVTAMAAVIVLGRAFLGA
jgi:uncharacterized membrane protein YfcA